MFSYFMKTFGFAYSLFFINLLVINSFVTGMANKEMNTKVIICEDVEMTESPEESQQQSVVKVVLDNGLTVLIHENHKIPKVSLQLWCNVGSKDELLREKGIAHLLEHMVFKGTSILSESDIKVLTHKLSGTYNACTDYDYTYYRFDFPTQHWREALPIFADCMTNCRFEDDMLNSELKAVIQELKLRKDQYRSCLLIDMLSMIFADHPYHYPLLGYKHDLWDVTGKDLLAFYKKHYKPNNATLVIVGDIYADEVVELAKRYFGGIPKDPDYVKKDHFLHRDIASKSLTLYRDVVQPTIVYAFIVPGAREKNDVALNIFNWIFGRGRSSRLYKKLINETQLASSISTRYWNLFDYGLFYIFVNPKKIEDIAKIEKIVIQELDNFAQNGIQDTEFTRGFKQTQREFYNLLENNQGQARAIGLSYLATGDENYVFTALRQPEKVIKQQIKEIIATCFRPVVMHKGYILPLPESEKKKAALLQNKSDKEDEDILSCRIRSTIVEDAVYAHTINAQKPPYFDFPKATKSALSNGLKIFYHHNDVAPKINIVLQFQSRSDADPEDKQGLYTFVTQMMTEGTAHYTSEQLADLIESHGMGINIHPGEISLKVLPADFVLGLEILNEIVTKAVFSEHEIEKVRSRLLTNIKNYWGQPNLFVNKLVNDIIYKDHPYHKQARGTEASISAITRDDLVDFYQKYISPSGARIAIVGYLEGYDVKNELEKALKDWLPQHVEPIEYPPLSSVPACEINYRINRDQVVLCFTQLSIDRKHPDYDKYLLFDQIFGSGVLGCNSSRLFDLRNQTGLFYTFFASSMAGRDEQPGKFVVCVTVSLDRLKEAEVTIKNCIDTVIDTLTEQDLEEAKRAVTNSLVNRFMSNYEIAATFLFLERFKFPDDYYDNRAEQLDKITLDDMKKAIKNLLSSDKLVTVRVGRV